MTRLAAAFIGLTATIGAAQTPAPRSFELASIKVNRTNPPIDQLKPPTEN